MRLKVIFYVYAAAGTDGVCHSKPGVYSDGIYVHRHTVGDILFVHCFLLLCRKVSVVVLFYDGWENGTMIYSAPQGEKVQKLLYNFSMVFKQSFRKAKSSIS